MQSFDQHLSRLYKAGRITLKGAKAASSSPTDFERALAFDDRPAHDDGEANFMSGKSDEVIELV